MNCVVQASTIHTCYECTYSWMYDIRRSLIVQFWIKWKVNTWRTMDGKTIQENSWRTWKLIYTEVDIGRSYIDGVVRIQTRVSECFSPQNTKHVFSPGVSLSLYSNNQEPRPNQRNGPTSQIKTQSFLSFTYIKEVCIQEKEITLRIISRMTLLAMIIIIILIIPCQTCDRDFLISFWRQFGRKWDQIRWKPHHFLRKCHGNSMTWTCPKSMSCSSMENK